MIYTDDDYEVVELYNKVVPREVKELIELSRKEEIRQQKAYRQSDKYKAYHQSDKYKAYQKAYHQSDKGKACQKAYRKAYINLLKKIRHTEEIE